MLKYIYSASARIVSMGSQFLLIAAIGNFGDIDLLGFWGPFVSFILISSIFLNFGQAAASYLKIPPLVKAQELDKAYASAKHILMKNFNWALKLCPIVAIVAFFTFNSLEISLFVMVIALLFSFGETSAALFRCFNRIAISEIVKNGAWRIILLSTVSAIFISGFDLSKTVITKLLFGAALVQTCLIFIYFVPRIKKYASVLYEDSRSNIVIDWHNWMIQSFQALTQNLDIILVAIIFTPSETAIYFLATRLTSIIALPLSVTNPVITPIFSLIAKNGHSPELTKKVTANTAINIASALTLFLILFLGADWVASFLSGETVSVKTEFLILAIGQTINASVGPTMQVAQLFNFRRHTIWLQFASLCIILFSALLAYHTNSVIAFAIGVTIGRLILNLGIVTLLALSEKTNIFTGKSWA